MNVGPAAHLSGQMSGQAAQMNQVGNSGVGVGVGGAEGLQQHQPMQDMAAFTGMDQQFMMLRSGMREKIFEYIGRKQSSAEWRKRLPELAKRLEEILYRKFPNKQNDYYNMTKAPVEPQLQFAIKTLSAQNQQNQQNPQMSRQMASSSGYGTMIPTPGMTQGASGNSRIPYVTDNNSLSSSGSNMVPQNANMGTSMPGSDNFTSNYFGLCSMSNGYQHLNSTITQNSTVNSVQSTMGSVGVQRQLPHMIPTPGFSNQQNVPTNPDYSNGTGYFNGESAVASHMQHQKQFPGNQNSNQIQHIGGHSNSGIHSSMLDNSSAYSLSDGHMNGGIGLHGSNMQLTNRSMAPEAYMNSYGSSPKPLQQQFNQHPQQRISMPKPPGGGLEQSKAKAEKNQAIGHSENENSCQLCRVEKLTFEPPPIYCSPCGARIKRNAPYYTVGTGDTRHYFCIPCYNESRGETIEVEGQAFLKTKLEKKRNDEETEEWWVQCDKCECWQHQICALFNGRRNDGGQAEYTCPNCYVDEVKCGLRKPLPQSAVLGAKDLPRTVLSDHIEDRLFKRLKQEKQDRAAAAGKNIDEIPGAEGLVVRVVSSVDKKLEVKPRFLEIFSEDNYPQEFPYKSKIGYLEYCKLRGFTSCYIWACPPLKGEDYILYCHPEIQKTPKSDKLREWYLAMLRKASKEEIVVELTNLYDHFFIPKIECKAKVTAARLPYFDGDYWPGAAEDMINQLRQEEDDRKLQKKSKTKKIITKRALKAAGHTDLSGNASKDAMLMQKRYSAQRCYDAEQQLEDKERHPTTSRDVHMLHPVDIVGVPKDTKDRDDILESEFFDTRQAFLSLCQGNHYQYDTLRRAKHSSMMVLYHLHNPTAPAFVTTCNVCCHDIETGQGWRCEVCPDFDVCNACFQKGAVNHPHKLTNHPSAADRDAQNAEARQMRVQQLRKMLDLLVHASTCRSGSCQYPNCRKVKGLFRHGMQCKTRASGGCVLCKKMWYMLQLHARACKDSDCNVPRCRCVNSFHFCSISLA
nr:unnamed protein product [Digitaria exilis]